MDSLSTIALSDNEQIVRVYDYENVDVKTKKSKKKKGKKSEEKKIPTGMSSGLVLTTKRLIYQKNYEAKKDFKTYSKEIPLSQIDSVESAFTKKKTPYAVGIVFGVILFLLGAVACVLSDMLGFLLFGDNVPLDGMVTYLIGGGVALIGVVLFILAFALGKKHCAFSLKVNRIWFDEATTHLLLCDIAKEKQKKKRKKSSKKEIAETDKPLNEKVIEEMLSEIGALILGLKENPEGIKQENE